MPALTCRAGRWSRMTKERIVAEALEPGANISEIARRHNLRPQQIFTTLPALAPGNGYAKTAWLWTYARDDRTFGGAGSPMVAYRFEDSRSAALPHR